MGIYVITGAASGIGAATTSLLRASGHLVVTVDLHDADVDADLSGPDGRAAMIEGVHELTGGSIDGVVAGAGIAQGPGRLVALINYYGAVATLDGLRPMLKPGSSAVAISSNSTSTAPQMPGLADLFLDAPESDALDAAETDESGLSVYPATKLALAHWVRSQAIADNWIGSGIRLNAIAPGFIATPMTDGGWDFVQSLGDDVFPIPIGRPGTPTEMAHLLAFLLSPEAGFFVGSVLYSDGGTDAKMRTRDWPTALG